MRVLIDAAATAPRFLAERTARSVRRFGWEVASPADWRPGVSPVLVVQAGVWWDEAPNIDALELCQVPVFGVRSTQEWRRALSRCGGAMGTLRWWHRRPVEAPKVWFLPAESQNGPIMGVESLWRELGARQIFHFPELDPCWDDRMRLVEAVTSIQIGGAERVALDLAEELRHVGVPTLLVALGAPLRQCYERPWRFFADVSQAPVRLAALQDEALRFGADVLHLHLVKGAAVDELRVAGWPVMLTLHNTREGWAPGITELTADTGNLLVLGCSRKVTRQFQALQTGLPTRCVWNGIRPPAAKPRGDCRARFGINAEALLVVSVANARPQKRLEKMPPVIAELRARGVDAHLIYAGSGTETLADGLSIHSAGLLPDALSLVADADVLLSTSAHEGLSLSQLEALALGTPVVATNVGGASEVPGVFTVPVDADARTFADAVQSATTEVRLPKSFECHAMARRYAWLARRCLTPWHDGEGILLIANNFSVGGAQSSARRLLLELKSRGLRVMAAVVEEDERRPTPGVLALREAGVEVHFLPRAGTVDTADACGWLLECLDARPPRCVVFWNLIASYKVVLADALFETGTRVVDVSPGEMFYTSLERYFETPRTGLPYRSPQEYGGLLDSVVVKYEVEAAVARARLGCNVRVVRNGVDSPATGAISKEKPRGAKFIIGTAARLAAHKRVEDLLDAFALLHARCGSTELWVAGGVDGNQDAYVADLKQRAKGLPVRWLGTLSDLRAFHESCDVFAMISEPAGCPNSSLEAMAAGLPVIATDVGGASEQVIDGETGLLVPPRDAGAMARALESLMDDEALRQRLARAGKAHVAARFSMQQMVEGYLDAFQGN
jgi:glycosyltransferase involved in cell wall biosynthesis